MPEEKKLTEAESLALITSMINKVKNSYIESGFGPLLWGTLITFCSLVSYAKIKFNFDLGFDVWLLTIFAIVPQAYFGWRSRKQKKFISHNEIAMNYVWSTFAITIFMVSFYNYKVAPANSIALFMLIYGVPTFITGGIQKFKPMLLGGIICWLCSITSYYTSLANGLLLMALSATTAWLIPGIILRRRYLKLKHV